MEFNSRQAKIIKSKPNGYNMIKGKSNSGKTTTILNRIPFLLKSYCLEENDSILMIVPFEESLKKSEKIYNSIESEKYHQESFFEKDIKKHFKINTIEKIAFEYINMNNKEYFNKYKFINELEKEEILSDIINNKKIKISKKIADIDFLMQEIKYIKSFNYKLEGYQNSNRKKHCNINIKKNSEERKQIFKIYTFYEESLKKLRKFDIEDIYILALKEAKNNSNIKYTHIIMDDAQEFTKVQIEFLKELYCEKSYSSFTLIIDKNNIKNELSYLSKNKSFSQLSLNFKGKTRILSEIYNFDTMSESKEILSKDKGINESLELDKIEYIDLKRNVVHNFIQDTFNNKEIYIEDNEIEEKEEDLEEIPVFNEIAAGSPIIMNDSIEDFYYLPKQWIRRCNNVFILKIKGDSMINRNINDGDYVVISKEPSANNNDIVAVEFSGEATLKTLKIKDDDIIFAPENEKYEPIRVGEYDEFNILGVAIGIIKNKIRHKI